MTIATLLRTKHLDSFAFKGILINEGPVRNLGGDNFVTQNLNV